MQLPAGALLAQLRFHLGEATNAGDDSGRVLAINDVATLNQPYFCAVHEQDVAGRNAVGANREVDQRGMAGDAGADRGAGRAPQALIKAYTNIVASNAT